MCVTAVPLMTARATSERSERSDSNAAQIGVIRNTFLPRGGEVAQSNPTCRDQLQEKDMGVRVMTTTPTQARKAFVQALSDPAETRTCTLPSGTFPAVSIGASD